MLLACAALACAPASTALEATDLAPRTGFSAECGIVLLRCRGGEANIWRVSRGAVLDLDLGNADHDVILTTAHGLSPRREAVHRDCRILAGGRAYRIEAAWRAAGAASATGDDWAVLFVSRKLKGDVDRLRPAQLTVDTMLRLAAQESPVRLMSRRPDLRQRDCNLLPIDDAMLASGHDGLIMFYSCRGAPGFSGSPILATIEGRPVAIGVHLGWSFERGEDGRLKAVSVGHPIDAQIAAALTAAALRARQ